VFCPSRAHQRVPIPRRLLVRSPELLQRSFCKARSRRSFGSSALIFASSARRAATSLAPRPDRREASLSLLHLLAQHVRLIVERHREMSLPPCIRAGLSLVSSSPFRRRALSHSVAGSST
jgi:hypothetical protein